MSTMQRLASNASPLPLRSQTNSLELAPQHSSNDLPTPKQCTGRLTVLASLALAALGLCISLSGCGGVTVNGASTNAISGSDGLSASPASIDFGAVNVGNSNNSKLTLSNSSTAAVVVSQLAVSDPSFTIDQQNQLPITVAGGGNTTLMVHFKPQGAGDVYADLTVTSAPQSSAATSYEPRSFGSVSGSNGLKVKLHGKGTSAAASQTIGLSVNATTVSFGSVALNSPSTQSLTLSSTGSAAVTVNSASVAGTGFSISGMTFPATINPGNSATLNVQFDPTAAGSDTGQVSISSNSATNANPVVALSGSGVAMQVSLTWDAPTASSDPVAGYKVYRAPSGSSSFTPLNSQATANLSYSDTSVQAGTTYQYYVTSVDSSGAESTPSNTASIAVP